MSVILVIKTPGLLISKTHCLLEKEFFVNFNYKSNNVRTSEEEMLNLEKSKFHTSESFSNLVLNCEMASLVFLSNCYLITKQQH